jgi:hypothetical protein
MNRTASSRGAPCPGALALDERWIADASPDDPVRLHAAACPDCAAHLVGLDEAAALVRRVVLPAVLEAAPTGLARWRRRAPRPALAFGLVLALGLALTGVAARWIARPESAPAGGGVAFKGSVGLEAVVQRGGQVFAVDAGAPLFRGDRVRFRLDLPRDGHLFVVALDARGALIALYPFGGPGSAPVSRHLDALPGSVELDGARGVERVYALFGAAPFTLAQVREAAAGVRDERALVAAERLPLQLDQASLLIHTNPELRP